MPHTYEYPRPALSVDLIVFRQMAGVQHVLLIERLHEPFANQWALPGGFMDMDETLEVAAYRELQEETSLVASSATQFGAFSEIDRDPRYRVVSVAFEMEVDDDQIAKAQDDAKTVKWFPLDELPGLAFDHDKILAIAIKRSDRS